MKKALIAAALLVASVGAFAQSSSTANQSSASTSVAQGQINFSQTPADSHLSETVRNVSGPVLGAYAASFSQMNCGQTAQGGFAVAGFSVAGGASKESASCVLEVAAAELTRQSTVDATRREALQAAAIGVRCQVSWAVYHAMKDAGFDCSRKPVGVDPEGE